MVYVGLDFVPLRSSYMKSYKEISMYLRDILIGLNVLLFILKIGLSVCFTGIGDKNTVHI